MSLDSDESNQKAEKLPLKERGQLMAEAFAQAIGKAATANREANGEALNKYELDSLKLPASEPEANNPVPFKEQVKLMGESFAKAIGKAATANREANEKALSGKSDDNDS